jgi:hypothetical protein
MTKFLIDITSTFGQKTFTNIKIKTQSISPINNGKMAEQQQISADYKSPTSSQSFSSKLPLLPKDHDVKSKTEYLSALRSRIVQMQSDVNAFLTKKMEEEKSLEASRGQGNKSKEEKAEETYGEEDPEAE